MATIRIPERCYLDTNFVLLLLSFYSTPSDANSLKCKQFYDKCTQNKSTLITSLLTYQECIYKLFYKDNLLKQCASYFEARGNRKADFRLKLFIKKYRSEFNRIYSRNLHISVGFHKSLGTLGIKLKTPRFISPGIDISAKLSKYAIGIIKKFNTLEPMDALHIATARCLDLNTIITSDKSFKQVPYIQVIDPIRDSF